MEEESNAVGFLQSEALRYRLSAVVLLALLAGFTGLTVAMYRQSFTDTAVVTVHGPRAGLQMRQGTVVKLRGVDVGKTGPTSINRDGTVDIKLKLKPDMLDEIPTNVHVSLEQLTAFGNKHVALNLPEEPASSHLEAGDVVDVSETTVEVNTVLDRLDRVLTTLDPAKVNAALGAIATSLNGQGENLGLTIETLNTYLGKINRDLPALQRDFDKGATVLDTYAAATPDLMKILSNGAVTADSISAQDEQLPRFLESLERVSNRGTAFLAKNSEPLIDLLASSIPTTELLRKYAPMYPCFLKGQDKANRMAEKIFMGRYAGVQGIVTVMSAGNEPYRNPDQLQVMAADDGPACYDMPAYDGSYYPQSLMKQVDRGGHPANSDQTSVSEDPLAVQLFGPLAGMGGSQ